MGAEGSDGSGESSCSRWQGATTRTTRRARRRGPWARQSATRKIAGAAPWGLKPAGREQGWGRLASVAESCVTLRGWDERRSSITEKVGDLPPDRDERRFTVDFVMNGLPSSQALRETCESPWG